MLVVDQIKSLYENILAMTAEEAQAYANATANQVESGSLQDLITTTTQYYLMLAKTKDAESGTTVYTESLQKSFGTVANYAAVYDSWLSSLNSSTNEFTNQTNKATSALENKKNALEDIKSGYENAIDSIKSLIDWTEKYIKQTKEDEIKSLEDKKKSVDDLIESKKNFCKHRKMNMIGTRKFQTNKILLPKMRQQLQQQILMIVVLARNLKRKLLMHYLKAVQI